MRAITPLVLLLTLCLFAAGCPDQDGQSTEVQPQTLSTPDAEPAAIPVEQPAANDTPPLRIWADPAFEVPLKALADDFQARYAPGYELRLIERGELLDLIAEGIAELPDVFVIAERGLLTALTEASLADETSARTFAGDRLVVARRPGETWASATLFDLHRLFFEGFGLADPGTALGYYSDQALISEGVRPRIEERLKLQPSIRALEVALAHDTVQIIMVYASTVVQADNLEVVLVVGEDLHEDIRYLAVAGAGRFDRPGVMDLLRFLAEDDEVQVKLAGYGLVDRETAMVEDRARTPTKTMR